MAKIEELRAAFEAATGGEWQIDYEWQEAGNRIRIIRNLDFDDVVGSYGVDSKDGAFIALAHNNMPALLEAVEALENLVSVACYPTNYVHVGVVDKAKAALAKLKGEVK